MPRFCICGCGKELKAKDGYTDYDRVFYNPACRNKDKAQRVRDQRTRAKEQDRCSKCGQAIVKGKKKETADV